MVKLDKIGRPYPVAADGVRRFGKDTVTRPPGMDSNIWWAASPKQRAEAWAKMKAREAEKNKAPTIAVERGGGRASSSFGAPPAVCCPLGALAFVADADPSVIPWINMAQESVSAAGPEDKSCTFSDVDEPP